MKLLDSQGRLFGKISILDIGAALVIVLVVIGIFFYPGATGSVAQIGGGGVKPVEIDLIVRGLSIRNPQALLSEWDKTKKTKIIIRNQPYGEIGIKSAQILDKLLAVPQPDGSVQPKKDPRVEESFSSNMLITLAGEATITPDGPVLGNNKLKIGTPIELEGFTYNFNSSVIDVRVLEKQR